MMLPFFVSMHNLFALSRENMELVFYSEGKSYWINFHDVIQSLLDGHKQKLYYITSSFDDPMLQKGTKLFHPFYIGGEFALTMLFKLLKAKVLITTIPDIGNSYLARSPHVHTLVYMHHTLGSMNMSYLPEAFNSYDAIICSGPHQLLEAREMEAFYQTRAKTLIAGGYPPLDDMIKRLETTVIPVNEIPVVTIAPSWQPNNIIDRVGPGLINSLLQTGFKVYLRPHPRTLKSEMPKVTELIELYRNEPNFALDNTPGSFNSYFKTDIMITDWSSTAIKYAFSMLRPVLFINTPTRARNKDYLNFKNIPTELGWRHALGTDMEEEDVHLAGEKARALLNDPSWPNRIRAFRKDNVFNPNKGGQAIAASIMELLAAAVTSGRAGGLR